jgi:hypothetical protein
MNFEFEYDTDTEQITIIYDGSTVLKVTFDDSKPVFKNFNKISDDAVEDLLKKFCKDLHALIG